MRKTSKVTARDRRLRLLFRITEAEWNKILNFQKRSVFFSRLLGTHLGTDHRHQDGKLRGILDWKLNRALGLIESAVTNYEDVPDVLRCLALYMENHPATTALGGPRYGLIGKAKVKRRMIYGPPKGQE